MNIGLLIKQSGFSKSCDGTDSYVGDYEDFERLTKAIRAEARAEHEKQEPVAIDGLARACNLAGIDYKDFLRIKAYLPVAAPVRTKDDKQ